VFGFVRGWPDLIIKYERGAVIFLMKEKRRSRDDKISGFNSIKIINVFFIDFLYFLCHCHFH
jgi:hypothetical protein